MVIPMYEMHLEKAMFAEHLGEINRAIILYKEALKYNQSGPVKKVEVHARVKNLIEILDKNCEEWQKKCRENSRSIF